MEICSKQILPRISRIRMKKKLSITINEEKIKELEKLLEDGRFRNKSHVIEYSLDKFLGGEKK